MKRLIGMALLLCSAVASAAKDPYAAAAGTCAAGAAEPQSPALESKPIASLYLCVNPMDSVSIPQFVELAFLGVSSCISDIGKMQQRMRECADTRIKAAVDSAGANADLKSAIKDFYVKQQSLIDAYGPKGTQSKMTYRVDLNRATTESDQAWSKVQLEAKLSGISP